MDTFTLVKRSLAATENDPDKDGLDAREIEVGRITAAVQVVVDALTPPGGGRYIVGFTDQATASTNLADRHITVSNKPLHDRSLSLVEKAVVIATFAAHEIGHTFVTLPRKVLIGEHNAKSGYHAVANLADDIILEPVMVDRAPILQDAFEFTALWVLKSTAKNPLPKTEAMTAGMDTAQRFNLLLSATRYGDIPEIIWANDTVTLAEKAWCRDWAERLIAAPLTDHATFLALCDEAWLRIRTPEPEAEQPPIIDCPIGPTGSTEDGEDEDEPDHDPDKPPPDWDDESEDEPTDEDGEDEGEGGSDESDEDDEDGESESEDDGSGDDDTDDEGDDTTDGDDDTDEDDGEDDGTGTGDEDEDDEDESDEGEPGEDESEGTDDSGENEDFGDESDEAGQDDESDPTEDADGDDVEEDAEGGGGNPDASEPEPRDEDDFDESDVDQSMHDQSTRDPRDWMNRPDQDEQAVRSYASTTRTAFGHHGHMTTTWD